jgi:hypothetical protein
MEPIVLEASADGIVATPALKAYASRLDVRLLPGMQ